MTPPSHNQQSFSESNPLNAQELERAVAVHCVERGVRLREMYGKFIDESVLHRILQDRDFVRHPIELVFDTSRIEPGYFGCLDQKTEKVSEGFVLYLHEGLKRRSGDLAAAVFYFIPAVNYGSAATPVVCEEFGSAALGLDREEYYRWLCAMADQLWEKA